MFDFTGKRKQFVNVLVGGGDISYVAGLESVVASRNDNLVCTFDG